MELLNFLISIVVLGLAVQFGEPWIVLGIAMIMIIASKSVKVSVLYVISIGVLYYVNAAGLKEYWLFAVIGLIAIGYLLGIGNEDKPADPYAGLLGGDMGLGGMGI